jgi:uncharacterized protein (TIGR00730 family)
MRVCVFTGSQSGARPAYLDAARAMGQAVARRGMGLVYGGASVGTMRAVADGALAAGGEVIGVIPQALVDREVAHPGLTELVVVDSMHARKQAMADRASAFVALPGGFGTLDELFEVVTWSQLGIHSKPIGLLDVAGFWEPVRALIDHMVAEGFVSRESRDLVLFEREPEALLDRLAVHVGVPAPRNRPSQLG